MAGRGSCAGLGWDKYCFLCFFAIKGSQHSCGGTKGQLCYVPMYAVPHTHSNGTPPLVFSHAKQPAQECQVVALNCLRFNNLREWDTMMCVCLLACLCWWIVLVSQ